MPMLLPKPRLHIVYDESDHRDHAVFLNGLSDVNAGRIVVNVTPDGRRLEWLAVDIERALGKDPHISAVGRNTTERWSRIHAWLIGGQAKTVFLSRVQLLDADRLLAVLELALASGVDLWLIAHERPLAAKMNELLADWPFEEVEVGEFRRRWRRRRPKSPEADLRGDRSAFPRVPLDEFVLFRAACRDLLPAPDFKMVDAAFQESAAAVAEWLKDRAEVEKSELGGLFQDMLGRCTGLDEAVTRLRGAQVAFFWHRYLLKIDVGRLLAAYAIQQPTELNADVARKLRGYGPTRYAAAAALALVTAAMPTELVKLNLGDIEIDDERLVLAGFGPLPVEACGLVAPHVVYRLLEGGEKDEALFTKRIGRTPAGVRSQARAIERTLDTIFRDLGVRVVPAKGQQKYRGGPGNWREVSGMSIQALAPTTARGG